MTNERRDLMFRAMDGHSDLAGSMHILNQYVDCDKILKWLIRHNCTGNNLREVIVKQFGSSVYRLVEHIVTVDQARISQGRSHLKLV